MTLISHYNKTTWLLLCRYYCVIRHGTYSNRPQAEASMDRTCLSGTVAKFIILSKQATAIRKYFYHEGVDLGLKQWDQDHPAEHHPVCVLAITIWSNLMFSYFCCFQHFKNCSFVIYPTPFLFLKSYFSKMRRICKSYWHHSKDLP